ncbi:MAG TPA: phenylalanine--tRNA ligase subunit beta [Candidatus Krumholzibacteria bacterium]|nr:phenylalanine--tRNA ligase subunit beta [Candidatus Krumholzibacteria bacterium]
MIVSVAWLRQYVEIPVDIPALVHDLTMHGLKVERVTTRGVTERLVVIGHVLEARPHPDAQKLRVCRVDVGSGEPLEIVCGAPNVAAGQKVPVALIGAKLPGDVKIRKSKIRGVTSNGMICSSRELGLGADSDGIMVLDTDAALGTPLADVLGSADAMLELEITPNRPDQLSHIGVAREIAAIYQKELRAPSDMINAATDDDTPLRAVIEDPAQCFRFTGRVIHGVKVGASPAWLKAALESAGMHSINNIVDVTNYLMLECGQPMHAYDLKLLPSPVLGVRRARAGESLETLDAVKRELGPDHLIITSEDEPVGIAGVIGGMPTRVTDATTDILLECAAFDPREVRRTRRALNVNTDASYRFERGSDRDICRAASDRATALIAQVAGGTAGRLVDEFPTPWPPRNVTIRRSAVRRLLGEAIPTEKIGDYLARLEFARTGGDSDSVTVAVPSFRWDVHEEADLVEEVARLYGYANIGRDWKYRVTVPSQPDALDRFIDHVSDHLVARGHTEVLVTSFSDGREAQWFDWAADDVRAQPIALRNPLTSNQTYMRTQLLRGVLDVVAHNLAHGRRELCLFSVGAVFRRAGEESALPEEPLHLIIVRTRPGGTSFWRAGEEPVDMFEIKAEVESLLRTFRPALVADLVFDFESTRGSFQYSGRRHAVVEGGVLPAAAAAALDVDQPLWYAIIDMSALFEARAQQVTFHPFAAFPASRRDLSLVAPRGVQWGQIEKHVAKAGGRLLESLQVFDVYQGAALGDRIAYGVRLSFRSAESTLKDAEVDAIVARIVAKLEAELGVVLRS